MYRIAAAAVEGHDIALDVLLKPSANINFLPAEHGGRTALQAAAREAPHHNHSTFYPSPTPM